MNAERVKPVCIVSYEASYLFSDAEWASLLRRNGVDITRPLRYHVSTFGCSVYYDDTFIGEGI